MAGEIIAPTAVAATVGAKLIYDVCGPTAKYLGKEIAGYSEIGAKNVKRVLESALKKVREQNKIHGGVPARILKEILSEAYFCEDELIANYLGGVLASSKGPVSRDDRGIVYSSLIRSLSTYELRSHCIVYTMLLRTKQDQTEHNVDFLQLMKWLKSEGVTVAFREEDYVAAMEFSEGEDSQRLIQHSFVGLQKHNLIEGGLFTATPGKSKGEETLIRWCSPTILGIELFLWGQGFGDRPFEDYNPQLLSLLETGFVTEPLKVGFGKGNYATT